jgi:predicted permease
MRDWLQDLRYGIRMIAKRPGTSAIAISALALGIGLTTTMFSIVQGVILRGLPFPQSERIAFIVRSNVQEPQNRSPIPPHDFVDFRDRQKTFDSLAGYSGMSVTIAGDSDLPERLRGLRMTPNTLSVLRVTPILGRDLNDADTAPGAPPVALISHRQWQSRFSSRRDAVGATVRLNGTTTTIVGVMPEKFGFPEAEQIWLPHTVTLPAKRGEGTTLNVIGRLRDGVTLDQASAELAGIARQLAETYPENKEIIARASPIIEQFLPARIKTTFYAMLTAVFGVMLIACVNVTNLQLARAAERAKEFAIRSALGSGRWRVLRQSLAEGLVLSVIGAGIGLGLAQFGVTYFMRAIADTQPPFWIDVRLDTTVLAFVTAITVAATLVSSVAPGLRVARVDANAVLKDDSRGATSVRMGRFGRWLVVVEVTVSCALLVVSGLMIRGIVNSSRLDYPFATRDVFFAGMSLDSRTYPDNAAVQRGIDDLLQRLSAIPGVRHAALTTGLPGGGFTARFSVEGATYATPDERPRTGQVTATPGFFDVMGVRVREGRLFNDADQQAAERVALVDEAFVATHLSGGPAIGRRIRFGDEKQPWLTIVGVVPSLARVTQPNQIAESVYLPLAQSPSRGFTILARTSGDPLALAPAIRSTVAQHFQDTPLSGVNSLAGELWRRGWAFRLFGGLFLLFGASALLMAAVGLYGVMAFMVRRRTQEIGVRMALGASRRGVLTLVMWQGLWRVALGIALGLYPGYALARQMQALASAGMSASDPVIHISTALTLLISGTLATLVPAYRASSVDPLTALRRD